MTHTASATRAEMAPAALTDALLRWSGMALLAAVVIVNEANFRVAEPDAATLDWQSLLRLGICALCGLYGIVHLPGIKQSLLRLPGILCLAFAAWALFTAPLALDPTYTLAASVSLICAILFAPAVLLRLGTTRLTKTLAGALLAFAAACWVAQFTRPELGQPEYLAPGQEPVWRLGGLTHPNGLGGFCALAIGCLGSLGATGRVRWRRLAAPLAFLGVTLWLTDSRTSQGAVAALVVLWWLRRTRPATWALGAALLAAGLLVAETAQVDWSQGVVGAARDGDADELYSVNGRTELWEFVIDKVARAPWLGYGFGGSRFVVNDFETFPAAHAHQLLLDCLLETGAVGALLLTAMLVVQFFRLCAAPAAFADAVTVLVIVTGLTETPIFNPVPEAFTLAWLIALFWRDIVERNSFRSARRSATPREKFSRRNQFRVMKQRNKVRSTVKQRNKVRSPEGQRNEFRSTSGDRKESCFAGHVVLLTNFIPPYRLPVYVELARRVEKLTILVSTPMEPNRSWTPDWGQLDVRVQRTLTLNRPWRHAAGFRDTLHVHVPYDTLGQLRALRPNAVLSAELGFRSAFAALYCKLLGRTPLVLWATLSEHTEQGRGWHRQILRRWLLKRADAVVVNGESGARYIERFGFEPRSIFRSPYVALPELLGGPPAARPGGAAHRLLYVGQLIERKGLLPFVIALAQWAAEHPDRQVAFDLAGSGPVEAELRSLVLPPNLSLNFLGERSYAELSDIYAAAGIFAFPTLADEWGLVVNEAMAAGLPVLGSRYSQAVEELCRENESGWTFHPDCPDETMAAIDRAMATSVERLNAMRAAARAAVAPLTPTHAVDGLLQAIHAATNKETSA